MAIIYKHRNEPIPRLVGPLAHWQPFIERLLAKRPADRYGTAAEAADALRGAADAARAA
jgi:serine/threonine-protein kinase PpkA